MARTKPLGAALRKILGQPSWRIANDKVEAYVTRTGGHVGPVKFRLGRRVVEPFSVAPWATERHDPSNPRIINVLRGDFFCMPFGGNATPYRRERHPVHGESANSDWTCESFDTTDGQTSLHLSLKTRLRRGLIDKRISLVKGHSTLYCQDVVSGMSGPTTIGHHAMLRFPDEPGSGIVTTSPFTFGQVYPGEMESPANGGYSLLKPGAEFDSLQRVATMTGETADLTRYPARRGFEDLVMIVSRTDAPLAWTAVTFPKQRYVWFALKDPAVLRGTIFWISNGGRHYAPWSGRHVNVMGLEDVTSYFHYGIAESAADNPLSRQGIPTSVQLDPKRPLVVNYIMATAAIPAGFDAVDRIEPKSGGVTLHARSGASFNVAVDLPFLSRAAPE